jgi:hypothetical protein
MAKIPTIKYEGQTYERYLDMPVGFAKQATARLEKAGIKVILRPKGKDKVTVYTSGSRAERDLTSKQREEKMFVDLDLAGYEGNKREEMREHKVTLLPYGATRVAIPTGTHAITITPVHMGRVHRAKRGGLTRRSNR